MCLNRGSITVDEALIASDSDIKCASGTDERGTILSAGSAVHCDHNIHTLLQNVVAAVEQMVSASMDSAGVHLDLLKLNVFVWQSTATHPHHPALDRAVCAVITDMDYL